MKNANYILKVIFLKAGVSLVSISSQIYLFFLGGAGAAFGENRVRLQSTCDRDIKQCSVGLLDPRLWAVILSFHEDFGEKTNTNTQFYLK